MRKLLLGVPVLVILLPVFAGIYLLRNPQTIAPPATAALSAPINDTVSVQMPQSALDTVLSPQSAGEQPDRPENSRIDIIQDGTIIPINNGQAVPFGDDWQIEVFVSPYPPDTFEATVDFYLTTNDGQPVLDAVFNNGYDMAYMYHGRVRSRFDNLGNGHYVTSLDFIMYGLWEFDTSIQIPGQSQELIFLWDLYVWPVR